MRFSLVPFSAHKGKTHQNQIKMNKYPLNVVFGEAACSSWDEKGYDKTSKLINKGKLDGSAMSCLFDTEHDRQLATELLEMADGWLDNAWDTSTFSWIRPGAKCRWNDPGINDYQPGERKVVLERVFEVVSVCGMDEEDAHAFESDDIIVIHEVNGASEAEVYASELVQISKKTDMKKTMLEEKIHNIVTSGLLGDFSRHVRDELCSSNLTKKKAGKVDLTTIERAMRETAERVLNEYLNN